MKASWRVAMLAIVCVVCLAVAAALVVVTGPASDSAVPVAAGGTTPSALEPLLAAPHGVFVETRVDRGFGHVVVTDLARPDGPAVDTGLECERVTMAADSGICLTADRGAVTTYQALVVDSHFRVRARHDVAGTPSRTRVAPSGRIGAVTTFVSGDSYAAVGFSTRTELLDLSTGASIGDLETFTIRRDGEVIRAADANFWGVTFADDDHFYATLGTGEHRYLVEGHVAAREVVVVRDGIECPSLSPDGTRIAFKQRVDAPLGRIEWRLAVLDLGTGAVRRLTEDGNVDDQAYWLDDGHLLYARSAADAGTPTKNTWSVPADGSAAPTPFAAGASSFTAVPPGR